MEYFVTGATGFIGTHLVERLAADGHQVTALTRDRSNATHLPESVSVIEGDITEKASMRAEIEGVDGIFHLAAWFQIGPGPWNSKTAERINVDGTRNVLELMDDLDIPKGVYVSTVGVYGDTGSEYVDESYRAPNDFPSVYQRTKWQAHYEVAEPMIDDGLPLVITTLGAVFGPGDRDYDGTPRTGFTGHLNGDLPMIPNEFVLPWDYVEDTAANITSAMEHGEPGEEYIIANEPRNIVEVFDMVEEFTGISRPRAVPSALFTILGYGMLIAEQFTKPPEGLESELLRFFASGRVLVDNSKAERDLEIEHRPLDESLRTYLDWELTQQGLESTTRQLV
ncbi:dihydroflavonol-4-reductase [Halorubrum aquaticum]|uniref:Dihydroflavonol-4-reductase n=1 Tax=Halorubrum aquaticum TaxID=387340 RepID=A0A1I2Z9Y1_9EURY|nr:NAD-dependent epimerase/dehydratase family protein [Halorubrum aquaticum]SFH34604.1 dihydroflavonol-4-reductase [Halorubrum aquaticum]